jgi:hypothetical protein
MAAVRRIAAEIARSRRSVGYALYVATHYERAPEFSHFEPAEPRPASKIAYAPKFVFTRKAWRPFRVAASSDAIRKGER